ncbi:MAG: hypothetical protein F7C81_01475 [Desulfurococcales archaeon]|nr:hypothetical protein [Desulfurococcales archaeon]
MVLVVIVTRGRLGDFAYTAVSAVSVAGLSGSEGNLWSCVWITLKFLDMLGCQG